MKCIAFALLFIIPIAALSREGDLARALQSQAAQPLLFMENKGQIVDASGKASRDILFTAKSKGAAIFLSHSSISYQFTQTAERPSQQNGFGVADIHGLAVIATHRFDVRLSGANPAARIRKEKRTNYHEDFYLAHCPQGITGVASYERLVYEEVYPNIDWVVYSNGAGLKYDFVVRPGGDPARIRLRIEDAGGVSITPEGELLLTTPLGEIREAAPVSFAQGKEVATAFEQHKDGTIGFRLNGWYPAGKTLTIDPAVQWSTYYGGAASEYGRACATDAGGNVYLAGVSSSSSSIASGGFQNIYAGPGGPSASAVYGDAFLVKFSPSGARLWATYYGGGGEDYGFSCAVDGSGNVFLAGGTSSTSGISSGGHQNIYRSGGTFANGDAFLVKFNSAGIRQWATYYGDSSSEQGFSCAADAAGNVYLTGITYSSINIATGGFQNTYAGAGDGFVVKFNAAGVRQWATYYGGSGLDHTSACAVSNTGDVYVAGSTSSTIGIASGGFQNTYGGGASTTGGDAFLVKFNSSGTRQWATYYGGSGDENGFVGAAADASGNIYLTGFTTSASGIAAGGFQNAIAGGSDAFLVKFNGAGTRLWATYYGGSSGDGAGAIGTDGALNVFIAGYTNSATGIAFGGVRDTILPFGDGFIAKFDSAGTRRWGTYYGHGQVYGAAVDGNGVLYAAGSTIFPTGVSFNGFQNTYGGGNSQGGDAFLGKIVSYPLTTHYSIPTTLCAGQTVLVPFNTDTPFLTGNVFTAQLSNASGSFASPVSIGTITATGSGSISATIPSGTASGTGYRIRVVGSNPSVVGTDNGINITITAIPATPGVVSGSATVCSGSTNTYSIASVPGATSYTWTLPTGWIGSSTGTSISAMAGSAGGTITVTSNNACGSSTTQALATSASPTVTPSISISTASATICAGSPATFTAAPVNGGAAPQYQWKKNGVNVGTSSNTYTDNFLNSGDVIACVLTSDAACAAPLTAASNTITITVVPVPSASAFASGSTAICQSDTVMLNAAGGGTYQWQLNGNNIPGAASASYAATAAGAYTVVVTSTAACTAISAPLYVTTYPLPAPVIFQNGTMLTVAQSYTSYQWYLSGSAITGATAQSHTATQNGTYTVRVADVNGCMAMSNAINIQNVGIENVVQAKTRIYPNPTTGLLQIEAPVRLCASLRDPLGRELFHVENVQLLDLTPLADGLYFLYLSDAAGQPVLERKVVKKGQ